jgi:hypothetical protein
MQNHFTGVPGKDISIYIIIAKIVMYLLSGKPYFIKVHAGSLRDGLFGKFAFNQYLMVIL